jgi:hypothetical protein
MPNWTSNVLEITNLTQKDIDIIINDFCSVEKGIRILDFEKILPTPPELLEAQSPNRGSEEEKAELIKKYGDVDWYNWRCKNWGVKWSPSPDSSTLEIFEGRLEFFFDTPWSPPSALIEYLSKLFPRATLKIQFAEPGNSYSGEEVFMAGNLVSSHDDPDGVIMRQIYGEPEEDNE